MNWILFWLYLLCVLSIIVFIAILIMHIGEFRQYSRYITPVLRLYIVLVAGIAVFGAYMVLTSDIVPTAAKSSLGSELKLEF